MAMISILPLPAFNDNYIWAVHDQHSALVVDPGDAEPVLAFLHQQQLKLDAILITHHHWDHTNGVAALKAAWPNAVVYGPKHSPFSGIDTVVTENDTVRLNWWPQPLTVISLPGHTLDHIGYVWNEGVFCGDTLFSGGCGRLFEGTPEQMCASLEKLAKLPENTNVYCTHEYTQSNLTFAQAVDENNDELRRYSAKVDKLRALQQPSLPSNIRNERQINPFLRCHSMEIKHSVETHLGQTLTSKEAVFAGLRGWKDRF